MIIISINPVGEIFPTMPYNDQWLEGAVNSHWIVISLPTV